MPPADRKTLTAGPCTSCTPVPGGVSGVYVTLREGRCDGNAGWRIKSSLKIWDIALKEMGW